MRILVVHNTYQFRGGEDTVVESEISLLRSHGHDVITWFRSNDDVAGMSLLSLVRNTLWSRQTPGVLAEYINRFQPDLIHVHNTFPLISPSLYWAAVRSGVPVVQTLHNFRLMCLNALFLCDGKVCEACLGKLPRRGVVKGCYRDSRAASSVLAGMLALHRGLGTFRNKVTRYIVLNEFCRNKFIEGGFPSKKIKVKPNFANLDDADISYLKKRGGCHKGSALFVGRMSAEKGIATLLRAWQKLDIPLRIVGDGPLMSEVNEADIKTITILGKQTSDQVSNEMRHACILLMPSECYEGFPMVLVEAFAHGLPVIASRLGSMAEIVQDGVTGLHFEAGNSGDLAEKIKWMYERPEECKRMGENARSVYEEKYTPERNYKMLLEIYMEAIKENVLRLTKNKNRYILGMRVDVTRYSNATKLIFEWASLSIARYICVANVHMCMEAYDDECFRDVVDGADMVVPDGRPLVWALKLLGIKEAGQVRGSDLFLAVCEEAQKQGVPIGLYGASPSVLNDFQAFITNKFPTLKVAIAISPPFRELTKEEDKDYIDQINASGIKILFVGIGCPKQEKWMYEHRDSLSCVMIGVGAAFDFFSGHKKHAPKWMQKIGFEWVFRLSCEPRRLWKRYLKQNPRFLWLFAKQLIRKEVRS